MEKYPNLVHDERQKVIYSVQTIEGLKITGMCLWCLSLCMTFYEDDRCRYIFCMDLGAYICFYFYLN